MQQTFKFEDLYTSPAIPISAKNESFVFDQEIVNFDYNSYGYRTHEFVNVKQHIAISGCSLTEGHGLHLHQTWASKFEKSTNTQVFNLAKGCSSAEFVSQNLQNWIRSYTPKLVVAQWPNPYRSLTWKKSWAMFNVNSDHDEIYRINLRNGDENFYHGWCNSIITLNYFCQKHNIPIVNMCLESVDMVEPALPILEKFNIELHYDQKVPGKTWFFDSAALDKSHHSEFCNEKWTQRLLTLI